MLDQPYHMPQVLVEGQSAARALVRGDGAHPELLGEVLFYPFRNGSLLLVRMAGLPGNSFFGFHIHEHGDCRDGGDIPFYGAGGHYDPAGRAHPNHAGDLPVLLANDGQAYTIFYTGRFTPDEVVGRSVVVHEKPDDYRGTSSGDSGNRIACGRIEPAP